MQISLLAYKQAQLFAYKQQHVNKDNSSFYLRQGNSTVENIYYALQYTAAGDTTRVAHPAVYVAYI